LLSSAALANLTFMESAVVNLMKSYGTVQVQLYQRRSYKCDTGHLSEVDLN
jgi:hypothetical protein